MPTLEEENAIRNNIYTKLENLSSITPEDLIQEDRLGTELSFKTGVPYFERALSLLETLKNVDISRIPYNQLTNLSNVIDQVATSIDQIKNFTVASTSTPAGTRDSLINSFRDNYNDWFIAISPIIAFCVREGTDFQALQNRANEIITQLNAIEHDVLEKSTALIKDTEETLEKVRRAAAEVGVSQHATHFQKEASYYEQNAKNWLLATGIFSLATIIWGFFSFYFLNISPDDMNNNHILFIQAIVARGSVLLVLFMSLVWCSKNYAAVRHNYIINKQRQNALSTFETFVKAAGDEDIQTKNAVLLQATQCIFSAQPTGFSNKNSEGDPSTKIIEIAKDFSKIGK